MAGISQHIHQSGHPFPLGLYIGFTRLHGVALLRGGIMFDCNEPAPIAYMAGISEHIHQSGHPFALGLYIGSTRLHGVALLREGTVFDSVRGPLFGFGLREAAAAPWMPRAAASLGCLLRCMIDWSL